MFIEPRFYIGRPTDLMPLADDLHRPIDAHAGLGERQGWRLPSEKVLEVFALDIERNAQGIESRLDSEGK